MVQTSSPENNVRSDFVNLTNFRIKKKYSEMLLKQLDLGNLKIAVSQKLKKMMEKPPLKLVTAYPTSNKVM